MANGDVDGGAAPDLEAGGRRLSERSAGCGVGATGTADPTGPARRATAQDRHAGSDERHSLSAADRVPWRYLPGDGFPPRSTVYNIFRKFQHEGVWEAIWAELHMALRERMGRETSPSAAVLDSQSIKAAEKGAVTTAKWAMTPARRSRAARSTPWSTAKGCRCGSSCTPPRSRTATGPGWSSTRYAGAFRRTDMGRRRATKPGRLTLRWQRCRGCAWRSSSRNEDVKGFVVLPCSTSLAIWSGVRCVRATCTAPRAGARC